MAELYSETLGTSSEPAARMARELARGSADVRWAGGGARVCIGAGVLRHSRRRHLMLGACAAAAVIVVIGLATGVGPMAILGGAFCLVMMAMIIAIFGPDPGKRERALERGFAAYFRTVTAQAPLCARLDGVVVGVAGVLPPGRCQLSATQKLRLIPSTARLPIRSARRASRVTGAWAARDPGQAHSHLRPMAVDEGLKGRGIGTQLLKAYCKDLDRAHLAAYLETETARNVRFYKRFAFEIVDCAEVLGGPNWFMWRSAR